MHTFTYTSASQQNEPIRFHYNSDLSGDVLVDRAGAEFSIPGQALLKFIAAYVCLERISALERMTPKALLGIREE